MSKGRTVPIYRPGINRAGEVQIPTHDLTTASGRVLAYKGRTEPVLAITWPFLVFVPFGTLPWPANDLGFLLASVFMWRAIVTVRRLEKYLKTFE